MRRECAHVLWVLAGLALLAAWCLSSAVEAEPSGKAATVIRVDVDSTAADPDGLTWDTAFPGFQEGVDAAADQGVQEVWVAGGSYKGLEPVEVEEGVYAIFRMRKGVHVYGGFAGTESSREQRDWEANPTVLDGVPVTLPVPESTGLEAFGEVCSQICEWYVLYGADDTVLDGVTMTVNWPDDDPLYVYWYWVSGLRIQDCASLIRNCIFSEFFRVGFFADSLPGIVCRNSVIGVENCTFDETTVDVTDSEVTLGGSRFWRSEHADDDICRFSNTQLSASECIVDKRFRFRSSSSATLALCRFIDGVHVTSNSSCAFTNCVFAPDFHAGPGAVMYSNAFAAGQSAMFVNCTFAADSSLTPYGAPLWMNPYDTRLTLRNCVLWNADPAAGVQITGDDVTVVYSDVQGGYPGDGNIDEDPLFVDAENGDFRLRPCSPCVEAGTLEGAPEVDMDGIVRPQGQGVDMGAYEFPVGEGEGEAVTAACDPVLQLGWAPLRERHGGRVRTGPGRHDLPAPRQRLRHAGLGDWLVRTAAADPIVQLERVSPLHRGRGRVLCWGLGSVVKGCEAYCRGRSGRGGLG